MADERLAVSVGDLIDRLSIVNTKIFFLESDIRRGVLTDEREIGKRAQQIRDLNAERVALKNSLNAVLEPGVRFPEVKVSHRSAG